MRRLGATPTSQTTVLIVGAGPTGLTLASELVRRGVPCRIIDRERVPSVESKALAVHARTLEIFESMGIVDPFLEQGWKLCAFNVFDRTRHIVRMTFDELESRYPFVLSLPQCQTEAILGAHLTSVGGRVDRGVTLVGLAQQPDCVTARLATADGAVEELTCDWVIGCDGADSAVRQLLGIAFAADESAQHYVLADVEFGETSVDIGEFYLFGDAERRAGFHPFSRVGARIVAPVDSAPNGPADAPATLEQLQRSLDGGGPGGIVLTKLNWCSAFSVHRGQAALYRKGRAFLAGDAAHVHSPVSGQGMNVGIQDAFNLAWKLALVATQTAPASLLDSYAAERCTAARRALRMTEFFARLTTWHNPLARKARDVIGPFLSRNETIRRRYRNAVSQLSVHYRHSPIVGEHLGIASGVSFTSAPRAGERAPDSPLVDARTATAVRLFDVLRDDKHHLLLLTGTSADPVTLGQLCEIAQDYSLAEPLAVHLVVTPETRRLAASHWNGQLLVDEHLAMHHRYGASAAALYLIRPDGYVGFRSLPVSKEKLSEHLRSFFLWPLLETDAA